MQDKRRSDRLGSWLHATYQATGSGEQPYNSLTRNVSEGGIGLFTDRPFDTGAKLQIEIACGNQKLIRFSGEVRWSRPLVLSGADGPPRAFETGIRFVDITPEDQKQLMLYTVLNPPPAAST